MNSCFKHAACWLLGLDVHRSTPSAECSAFREKSKRESPVVANSIPECLAKWLGIPKHGCGFPGGVVYTSHTKDTPKSASAYRFAGSFQATMALAWPEHDTHR